MVRCNSGTSLGKRCKNTVKRGGYTVCPVHMPRSNINGTKQDGRKLKTFKSNQNVVVLSDRDYARWMIGQRRTQKQSIVWPRCNGNTQSGSRCKNRVVGTGAVNALCHIHKR